MRQGWSSFQRSWAWVAVLMMVGLTLSGCQVWFYRAVPAVVGQAEGSARGAIESAGFAVGTVTQACDNTVPAGSVISQDPFGGTRVSRRTAVNLVVS